MDKTPSKVNNSNRESFQENADIITNIQDEKPAEQTVKCPLKIEKTVV